MSVHHIALHTLSTLCLAATLTILCTHSHLWLIAGLLYNTKIKKKRSKQTSPNHIQHSHQSRKRYHPLTHFDIAGVKKFLFFTGYPRSGHSIVGSLIDAHPNILLSFAFYLFSQLLSNSTEVQDRETMFEEIHKKSFQYSLTSPNKDEKGYTLDVPGSWAGRFMGGLKVIGDKSAKAAPDAYLELNNQTKFLELYQRLQDLVKAPLHVIHVVRNPFDIIATHALYEYGHGGSEARDNFTEEHRLVKHKLLNKSARGVMRKARAVQEMMSLCNMTVLEIHNEDLVQHPAATVIRICKFLEVPCPSKYITACVDKVFPVVSKTRNKVEWAHDLRQWVEQEMNKYPFFNRYSFDLH